MAIPSCCFEAMAVKAFSDHHSCLLRLGSRLSPVPLAQLGPRNTHLLARAASNVAALPELQGEEAGSSGSSFRKEPAWRETVDKNGLLRSPRAARELALCLLYAGLVSERKPMWVFKERLKQASGGFSLDLLTSYSHLPENGDAIFMDDAGTSREAEQKQDEESLLEAAVLSAPLPLVYNKFVLKMAENIIKSTNDCWSQHEVILDSLLPKAWKARREGVMLPICILHMAMAEMVKIGTSSAIVINEAVELTKRFSDIHAARVVNGCLGKFINSTDFQENELTKNDGALSNKENMSC